MSKQIELYLAYLNSIRSLSQKTLEAYGEDLSLYEASCKKSNVEVECADSCDVRNFISDMTRAGHAASSINRALSAVKGFYRYLLRFNKIKSNPAKDIECLPGKRNLPGFLFNSEMENFIGKISTNNFYGVRDKALFETLYSTGCRVSELSDICLSDIDFENRRIKVKGKGAKERIVFLSFEAINSIRDWLPYRESKLAKLSFSKKDSFEYNLFLNTKGTKLGTRGIAYIIEQRSMQTGLKHHISPHSFRHSFATQLIGNGADIRIVQELLGHENISTTQIYTHVDIGHLRSVYNDAHPHAAKAKQNSIEDGSLAVLQAEKLKDSQDCKVLSKLVNNRKSGKDK